MAQVVRLKWGSVSVTGNYRENNEDRCFADGRARFFLVADGMGGQSAGEKASELAIELVSKRLDEVLDFEDGSPRDVAAALDRAVGDANADIMALGELDPKYHNMGTTLTFLLHVGGRVYVGGIGDSRTYVLRDERLTQLTKDHSLTQALVDAGTISANEAAHHRYRNVLWRYLGTKEGGAKVDAQVVEPRPGDRFLLCSDGVCDGVDDESLRQLLVAGDDPQTTAEEIVAAAERGGSRDNITCVVVFVS